MQLIIIYLQKIEIYHKIFDEAESAVSKNSTFLKELKRLDSINDS